MSGDLSAVREVWAHRSQARTRSDILYLLYLAALSVLVLGVPALRAAGSFLARPDVLPALQHPLASQVAGVLVLLAGAGMVLLGGVRGPALLAPFLTVTLAASGIRRRTALWRPFLRALLAPVLAMVVLASLIAATLRSTDAGVGGAAAAWFVLAAAGSGLLLGVAWLTGQLLGPGPRRLLMASLLAAAALSAVLEAPWGLGGAYPVTAGSAGPWASLLLGGGILAVAAGVAGLDRLRGAVLREQAMRWEDVSMIATSGDLAGAAGGLRTPPSAGRRLRATGPGPLVLLYARRDAVGWLRSPERTAAGALAALAASALLAGAVLRTGPLAWCALALGTAMLWAAAGALVDGVRHGVHTLGAPTLFGQTAAVQVLLHTVAPVLLLTALGASGGGAASLLAGDGPSTAALLPVVLAPVLVAGRVRDAAKGPMPLKLMTPMPTAQGDGAVLVMLAWQSDALLLALLCGVVLCGLAAVGPLWLVGGGAAFVGAMAVMARARLRDLRG